MITQGFISPEGLQQLKNYTYKPGKYTWLDNALQPYWNYCVSLVPLWVAPNLLTFLGWILLLSSAVVILFYDFTFTKMIPSWCFYYAAFCVWAYSTLDAIDGKQARRTQSSSPLGQLFDHGCDAFSVSFIVIGVSAAAQLQYQQVFSIYMASYTAFWLANWKQYNTGILVTNVGQFGVTQCQLVTAIVYILTGIFGQTLWKVSPLDLLPSAITSQITNQFLITTLKVDVGGLVAYYFGLLIFLSAIFELIRTLFRQRIWKPLIQCLSLFILMACCLPWLRFSFFQEYTGVIMFSFGLLIALLVCKIIISSVTKMKLVAFHKQLIPLIVATILMEVCEYLGSIELQHFIFWGFLITIVLISLKFLSQTISQISIFLGIYCFSLQRRKPQQSQKAQ